MADDKITSVGTTTQTFSSQKSDIDKLTKALTKKGVITQADIDAEA